MRFVFTALFAVSGIIYPSYSNTFTNYNAFYTTTVPEVDIVDRGVFYTTNYYNGTATVYSHPRYDEIDFSLTNNTLNVSNYTVTNEWILDIPSGYEMSFILGNIVTNYAGPSPYIDGYNYEYGGAISVDWTLSLPPYNSESPLPEAYSGNAEYSTLRPYIMGPAKLIRRVIMEPYYYQSREHYIWHAPDRFSNRDTYYFNYFSANQTLTDDYVFHMRANSDYVNERNLELLETIVAQSITNIINITSTNTITNTIGYSLSEVADMRLGSQMVSVSNSQALLRFGLDMSDDLTATWQTNAYEIEVEIPATNDVQFFRLRMD